MLHKYNDLIYHCKECPLVPKIGIVHENNEIYVEYLCINNHYRKDDINNFFKNINELNIKNKICNFCKLKNNLIFCFICEIYICENCLKKIHNIKFNHNNKIIILNKIYDNVKIYENKKFFNKDKNNIKQLLDKIKINIELNNNMIKNIFNKKDKIREFNLEYINIDKEFNDLFNKIENEKKLIFYLLNIIEKFHENISEEILYNIFKIFKIKELNIPKFNNKILAIEFINYFKKIFILKSKTIKKIKNIAHYSPIKFFDSNPNLLNNIKNVNINNKNIHQNNILNNNYNDRKLLLLNFITIDKIENILIIYHNNDNYLDTFNLNTFQLINKFIIFENNKIKILCLKHFIYNLTDTILLSTNNNSIILYNYNTQSNIVEIQNIYKLNKIISILSVNLILDNYKYYILISNYWEKNLKLYNIKGKFIKDYINCENNVKFITNYYDKKLNKNFIITCGNFNTSSFLFEDGKLYKKYCLDFDNKNCLIFEDNNLNIIQLFINMREKIKIFDFHKGDLIKEICLKEILINNLELWNINYLFASSSNEIIYLINLENKNIKKIKTHTNNNLLFKNLNKLYGECLIIIDINKNMNILYK